MHLDHIRLGALAAHVGDKAGAMGSVVSAMGCAMCFPAPASIGAALGLGFLSRWEGPFINILLPVFAWLVIIAHALGWLAHRQWRRSVAGMLGPTLVLLSLYPWWQYAWSTWTFYAGLGLMLLVAVWDLISPAHRQCPARDAATDNAPLPSTDGKALDGNWR